MSDEPIERPLPIEVAGFLSDPESMAQMDRSCELAKTGKLNTPKVNAQLKAWADKWRTMDNFSKRELGQKDQKARAPVGPPTATAQLKPGQQATVTGPSTIYGGQIEMDLPEPQPKTK